MRSARPLLILGALASAASCADPAPLRVEADATVIAQGEDDVLRVRVSTTPGAQVFVEGHAEQVVTADADGHATLSRSLSLEEARAPEAPVVWAQREGQRVSASAPVRVDTVIRWNAADGYSWVPGLAADVGAGRDGPYLLGAFDDRVTLRYQDRALVAEGRTEVISQMDLRPLVDEVGLGALLRPGGSLERVAEIADVEVEWSGGRARGALGITRATLEAVAVAALSPPVQAGPVTGDALYLTSRYENDVRDYWLEELIGRARHLSDVRYVAVATRREREVVGHCSIRTATDREVRIHDRQTGALIAERTFRAELSPCDPSAPNAPFAAVADARDITAWLTAVRESGDGGAR